MPISLDLSQSFVLQQTAVRRYCLIGDERSLFLSCLSKLAHRMNGQSKYQVWCVVTEQADKE